MGAGRSNGNLFQLSRPMDPPLSKISPQRISSKTTTHKKANQLLMIKIHLRFKKKRKDVAVAHQKTVGDVMDVIVAMDVMDVMGVMDVY